MDDKGQAVTLGTNATAILDQLGDVEKHFKRLHVVLETLRTVGCAWCFVHGKLPSEEHPEKPSCAWDLSSSGIFAYISGMKRKPREHHACCFKCGIPYRHGLGHPSGKVGQPGRCHPDDVNLPRILYRLVAVICGFMSNVQPAYADDFMRELEIDWKCVQKGAHLGKWMEKEEDSISSTPRLVLFIVTFFTYSRPSLFSTL